MVRLRFKGAAGLLVAAVFALIVGSTLPRSVAHANDAPLYQVTLLHEGGYVADVNEAGQVAGFSDSFHAWLWMAPGLEWLPERSTDTYSASRGINAKGLVVGVARGGRRNLDRPVSWKAGRIRNLPLLAKTIQGEANDVNDRGDVVGWCSGTNSLRATAWYGGKPRALKTPAGTLRSSAYAINAARQVVGVFSTISSGNIPRPCLWQGKQFIALTLPAGYPFSAAALDVNDHGVVVGYVTNADQQSRACVWVNGIPTVLGTFGGNYSSAGSVNEAGWIVGTAALADTNEPRPCLWKGGTMIDLTQLVPAEFEGLLEYGVAISNGGDIIVNGESAADSRTCYLLRPKG